MGGQAIQGDDEIAYTTLTGDPAQGAVPPGEYNLLQSLASTWETDTGFVYELNSGDLINLANAGAVNLTDIGKYITSHAPELVATQPWAGVGLSKDEYTSLATTFGSEYKKLTGQDIPADQLQKAFATGQTGAGGLLTGSEYAQQLMNDQSMQKTYGWLKYGMDYNQFQQQKLQMKQSFGNELTDSAAVTQLQYFHANQGPNMTAREQPQQSSQPKTAPGQKQSVVR